MPKNSDNPADMFHHPHDGQAASSSEVAAFRSTGIAVFDTFLDSELTDHLSELVHPLLQSSDRRRPGIRRVLERVPELRAALEMSPIATTIREVGGPAASIVRAVLFDKSPETNWLVPWHQDATIAVTSRHEVAGFGPWAVKDGEHHCQPPLDVLESIFTVRLHLDPCPPEAGPLRVVKGSHLSGLFSEQQIAELATSGEIVEAVTQRGGAVLTTPLAVHSSPKATSLSGRRRVLHLDCSVLSLPHPLRWAEVS